MSNGELDPEDFALWLSAQRREDPDAAAPRITLKVPSVQRYQGTTQRFVGANREKTPSPVDDIPLPEFLQRKTPETAPPDDVRHAANMLRRLIRDQASQAQSVHVFRRLAAADTTAAQEPQDFLIPEGVLKVMAIGEGARWRIVFQAGEPHKARLQGRQLQLSAGGQTFVLSPLDERGVARLELPAGISPADLLSYS